MQPSSLAAMRDDALALLVDDGTLVKIRCITCVREFYASPEFTTKRDEWLCPKCSGAPRLLLYGSDECWPDVPP